MFMCVLLLFCLALNFVVQFFVFASIFSLIYTVIILIYYSRFGDGIIVLLFTKIKVLVISWLAESFTHILAISTQDLGFAFSREKKDLGFAETQTFPTHENRVYRSKSHTCMNSRNKKIHDTKVHDYTIQAKIVNWNTALIDSQLFSKS